MTAVPVAPLFSPGQVEAVKKKKKYIPKKRARAHTKIVKENKKIKIK
jgi:hypothetical protein